MDNTKNDAYYVKKMIKDIKFIIEKTDGITLEALKENEVLSDSVHFRLVQTSENSGKLTQAFKDEHREIPWHAIKGLRNKIVHEYGDVDLNIIFQTITEDIPEVCRLLEQITFSSNELSITL